MVNLTLSGEQVVQLVSILGAAEEMFHEARDKEETPAMFQALLDSWADSAEHLRGLITMQHNEQVGGK